jgi:hypothetical protein
MTLDDSQPGTKPPAAPFGPFETDREAVPQVPMVPAGGLVGDSWPGRIIARVTRAERKDRKRRGRRCRRCRGTRQVRRLGARQVHRVKVVLTEQWHEWRG